MAESIPDEITRILTERIRDGAFQPSQRLPSETELSSQFNVSRPSVRIALARLEAQGLIAKRVGIGAFVTGGAVERLQTGLHQLESVVRMAQRRHLVIEVKNLEVSVVQASELSVNGFGADLDTPITRIRRVLWVGGKPVSLQIDYVSAALFPPSQLADGFDGSVLDWLLKHAPAVRITDAIDEITAVSATKELARELDVERSAPLILQQETLRDFSGCLVGYSDNYFVPSYFSFRISRRIEREP